MLSILAKRTGTPARGALGSRPRRSYLNLQSEEGRRHGALTFLAVLVAASLSACPIAGAWARNSHVAHSSGSHQGTVQGVARDGHGKILRSAKAKDDFKRVNPCPATGRSSGACPGYVIDHVVPLKRGGADAPYNMQWQTTEAAKIKDRWE